MDGHGGVIVILFSALFALFLVLPGIILVLYGVMLIVNRPRGLPLWGNRLRFAYELAEWYEKGTFQTEAQYDEIRLQLRSLAGWSMVGGGLGWLLGASVLVLGTLALPVGARTFPVSGPMLPLIIAQGASLGFTVGYLFGSARATHTAPHAPTYGDVRPRRPSDYFARWLAWVPVGVSALACAEIALLASLGDTVPVHDTDAVWTNSTRIILGMFVAIALIVNGLGFASIRWIALSPRTLLSSNTQAARGADDFRRAMGIGITLQMTWMSSGYLLAAAANIATLSGALTRHFAPVASAIDAVGFIFLLLCIVIGPLITSLHGRLGGTLTGWKNPFRRLGPVPAPQS